MGDDDAKRNAVARQAHSRLMTLARPALEAIARDRVRAGDDFAQLCGRVLAGGKRRETPAGEEECIDVAVLPDDTLIEWLAARNPNLVPVVQAALPAPRQHMLCVVASIHGYSVLTFAVSFAVEVGGCPN